ncbi:MAG: transcription termination factor Rho [Solirubrobacteraceae bacterium]|jgi:transcription termination factor Rho|nr:transcription termination factor Rho [Solirubrobacteraceae bacterium]
MTSVLDRDALEGSPLSDLHLIADQLGVDGYRRLRKAELVDAIVARQSGEEPAAAEPADAEPAEVEDGATDEEAPKPRRRRSRARKPADEETSAAVEAADKADEEEERDEPRPRRGGRRRGGDGAAPEARAEDTSVDGIVELQPNGSGFVRLNHPDTSDGDVYVSAAQVKRCELVTGDRVGGPVRPPRRSERYPSLVRVDTINGKPADEVAGEGTRFDDLPAAFPTERLELGGDDATVSAVEWLTPFGKGSRVVVAGGPLAGKSDLLRRIAGALAGREGLELTVVLAGVRPEEVAEWGEGIVPVATALLGASGDAQGTAIEQAVEQGRRVAARGGDAVVVIDSLDSVTPHVARRALAAARNIVGGGSLTVIAAAATPLGGETTVISLDAALTALRRFPNVDLAASGTMRPELLVGDGGAEKIAQAHAESVAARA